MATKKSSKKKVVAKSGAGAIVKKEEAAPIKGSMTEVIKAVGHIKTLSDKGLLELAKKDYDLTLDPSNGRIWLLKKIGYAIQAKVMGSLTGDAALRARALDDPSVIEEHRKAIAVTQEKATAVTQEKAAKGTAAKAVKPKAEKKAKAAAVAVGVDEDGFRKESKGSLMFALLKKGCTIAKLNEVGGAATPSFVRGIQIPIGDWPTGRSAKIEKDDKNIHILSYKGKDGKVHTLAAPTTK